MGAGDGSEGGAEEQKHKGPGLSSSMAATVPRGGARVLGGGYDRNGIRKHRRIGAEVRANSMQAMGGVGS